MPTTKKRDQKLRQNFRAASYDHTGQNPDKLYSTLDRDHDGTGVLRRV